jgi:hypothetical protein
VKVVVVSDVMDHCVGVPHDFSDLIDIIPADEPHGEVIGRCL